MTHRDHRPALHDRVQQRRRELGARSPETFARVYLGHDSGEKAQVLFQSVSRWWSPDGLESP